MIYEKQQYSLMQKNSYSYYHCYPPFFSSEWAYYETICCLSSDVFL